MHIGRRIAKIRLSKKLSQGDVAHGIISRSHYSNIEAGRFSPMTDTLEMIADRLDLPVHYLVRHQEQDVTLDEYINRLQLEIESKNMSEAYEVLTIIEDHYPYIPELEQELHFLLLQSLFYLRNSQIDKGVGVYRNEVSPLLYEEEIPPHLKCLYYSVAGKVYYHLQDYAISYDYYAHALYFTQSKKQEVSLSLNLALLSHKLHKRSTAIAHANQAEALSKEGRDWSKLAEVYNLLSVVYWEKNELETAEEYVHKTLALCEEHGITFLKEKLFHNYGLILIDIGQYQQSISFFYKSLHLKKERKSDTIIISYYSLLDAYLKLDDASKINTLLSEAIDYCVYEEDYYRLKMIEAKLELLLNNREDYENLIEEVIQYFCDCKMWWNLVKITAEYSEYLARNCKYKKAYQYMKLSRESLKHTYLP